MATIPAFRVRKTSAQTLTAGVATTPAYNVTDIDTTGSVTLGSNAVFTAPVAGLYTFNAGVYTESTVITRVIFQYHINGSLFTRGNDIQATTIRNLTDSITILLEAGDVVRITVTVVGANAPIADDQRTFWAGWLVTS